MGTKIKSSTVPCIFPIGRSTQDKVRSTKMQLRAEVKVSVRGKRKKTMGISSDRVSFIMHRAIEVSSMSIVVVVFRSLRVRPLWLRDAATF